MKKQILAALATVIAGLFVFTGCQDEKPYSFYQIGSEFSGLPQKPNDDNISEEDWIKNLPAEQKDQLAVANYLAGWLIEGSYVMTGTLGNPIVIEGADEAYNDAQAIQIYKNKVIELNKVVLDQIVLDAQKTNGSNGEPKLTVTTSGSVSFNYVMRKGSLNSSMKDCSTYYTVSYGPLNASNPE